MKNTEKRSRKVLKTVKLLKQSELRKLNPILLNKKKEKKKKDLWGRSCRPLVNEMSQPLTSDIRKVQFTMEEGISLNIFFERIHHDYSCRICLYLVSNSRFLRGHRKMESSWVVQRSHETTKISMEHIPEIICSQKLSHLLVYIFIMWRKNFQTINKDT